MQAASKWVCPRHTQQAMGNSPDTALREGICFLSFHCLPKTRLAAPARQSPGCLCPHPMGTPEGSLLFQTCLTTVYTVAQEPGLSMKSKIKKTLWCEQQLSYLKWQRPLIQLPGQQAAQSPLLCSKCPILQALTGSSAL